MNKASKAETLREACAAAGLTVAQARERTREQGRVIRRYRVMETLRDRDWSYPQIAEALGMNQSAIGQSLERLARIRRAVNG